MGLARERNVVLLLCALAAARVFVFSAAFPFFGTADEQDHFDVVVRYANADVPRAADAPSPEALPYMVTFGTPEYLWSPKANPGSRIGPPPWKQPPEAVREVLAAREAYWKNEVKSNEASQPPLYYALAGAWWRVVKAMGFEGLAALYALRFLNVAIVAATVALGWFATRAVAPGNAFVRIAVPALIAFMPQTIFYAINNDVLSPLAFGAAFVLLLRLRDVESPSPGLAAAAGAALSATFLTKIGNAPLLAVAAVVIALKLRDLARSGRLRASLAPLTLLAACAALPTIAWMAWCLAHFGDLTGSIVKIRYLGWTVKPLAAWLDHPIFTVTGAWTFVAGNLATFWQGESLWRMEPLAWPAADLAYAVGSLMLLGVTLVGLLRRPPRVAAPRRAALWFAFACLAATFAFFALLSVRYDFHDCFYPSRAKPYFTSGRLMLGMLIPFMILIAVGLDRALDRFGEPGKRVALALLLASMLATEIAIDWRIFPNDYNGFHL